MNTSHQSKQAKINQKKTPQLTIVSNSVNNW